MDDTQKELVVQFVQNEDLYNAVKLALRPYLDIEPYLQGTTKLTDSNELVGENTKAIFTAATIIQGAFEKLEDNYRPETEDKETDENEAV